MRERWTVEMKSYRVIAVLAAAVMLVNGLFPAMFSVGAESETVNSEENTEAYLPAIIASKYEEGI